MVSFRGRFNQPIQASDSFRSDSFPDIVTHSASLNSQDLIGKKRNNPLIWTTIHDFLFNLFWTERLTGLSQKFWLNVNIVKKTVKIRKQPSPEPSVRREGLRHDASMNGSRWRAPSPTHNSHNSTFSPPSPDSLNDNESENDRKFEQLDRSNRRRQRPQRYSTREFVEAVSENEADMDFNDDDDDIVGEAVYDDEYLKRRKERRKVSSSSSSEGEGEGDEEYRCDGDDDDNGEEDEDEGDDDESLSASEDSEESSRRFKKLRGRTRRGTKVRSVQEAGPRRSRRATRNRIDYKKYEFSDSETEPEPEKAETSNSSDKQGFSMGSSDDTEEDDNDIHNQIYSDNDNDDGDGDDGGDDDDEDKDEMKIDQPVIEEHPKIEQEEQNGTPMKLDSPGVQDEFENGSRKRRFLDLNELAPGSGFDDGPVKDDDDTDNF